MTFRTRIIAIAVALLASAGIYVMAQSKSFIWDSNIEPDMKEYVLVLCPTSPCTVNTAQATQLVVPHVAGQATHSSAVPNGVQGYAVVYARDKSLNLSTPSNEISFDSLAPAGPKNLRIG